MTQVAQSNAPRASHRSLAARRVELAGLLVASVVTITAGSMAIAARTARAGDVDADVASGRLVAINESPGRDALARALQPILPPDEARAVAAELRAWLTQQRAPNVGALSQITVPADRVRSNPLLVSLRERLDAAAARGRMLDAVPLLTSGQIAAIKPSLLVRRVGEFRSTAGLSLLLVLAAFYGLYVVRLVARSPADPLLLPAVHLLCGIGLTVMIGLRDPVRDLLIAPHYASGILLGALGAALAWRAPVERLAMQYAPLALAFILSMLLIVFGGGPAGSDARVNLWGMQPVEVIRLLIVLYLATFFARQWRHLRSLRDTRSGAMLAAALGKRVSWGSRLAVPPLEYVVPVGVALTLVSLFFAVQRDLGPALVFGCTFLALWAIAVRRPGLAAAGVGLLALGFWAVVRMGFPSSLATRVAMAADPWMNAQPGGNQIAHALWALASGGITGAGPGMGDPQYVPAGHTDLVLAVIGEELGFVGLVAVAAAYVVIGHRAVRTAMRAGSDFSCFLALGLTIALFAQLTLIAGGSLGLLPLSGVVTPFLSYGRSAMVANFIAIGVLLAISDNAQPAARETSIRNFARPVRWVTATAALFAVLVAGRAFHAQVWAADETIATSALVRLADGTLRFEDNPRLLAAADRHLGRGDIRDRNGILLATSNPAHVRENAKVLARLGVDSGAACRPGLERCYPFGGRLFHLLGDANTELDWRASNTSFVERDSANRLQGFNDFERMVTVTRDDGRTVRVVKHDYQELIPLVRHRYRPGHADVRALQQRPRDLQLTLDVRLQVQVADLLRRGVDAAGATRGAAAVMDPATGEILAAVSYPWPQDANGPTVAAVDKDARLDRLRYGLYPPGSTFKLVTAAATLALRPELASSKHMCVLLPDGRTGARVAGASRPIRDDALDTKPHGNIGLDDALRVSCNAYFAQLAMRLGADALLSMASTFDIDAARPNTPQQLRLLLPYAAFGQGETLASPLRMLGVAAAIANGGELVPAQWIVDPSASRPARVRVMSTQAANRLARNMAAAVDAGTGRAVAGVRPSIAGKTGTAEVAGAPSHSWFTGFAPHSGSGRRLAFVVLVENGGYGGRAAAPIAGRIVGAARELQLFEGNGE